MKKQVCFNKLIESSLISDSCHLQPSPGMYEKIYEGINSIEKGKSRCYSGLRFKGIAVTVCAALIITTSILAASPQARTYAAEIAESLGIKIFRLTEDDMNRIKSNANIIDVDEMKEGQTESINGITIQRAEQGDDNFSGAVLTEKLDQGIEIEKKIDSFNITEKHKVNIKENSDTMDVSELDSNEEIIIGGIRIQKSNK